MSSPQCLSKWAVPQDEGSNNCHPLQCESTFTMADKEFDALWSLQVLQLGFCEEVPQLFWLDDSVDFRYFIEAMADEFVGSFRPYGCLDSDSK